MKLHWILYMAGAFFTLASCKNSPLEDQSVTLTRGNLEINFTDKRIDSVINEYVKKYEVDPRQRVLAINIYRDPIRDFYYLTQVRRKQMIESNIPDYFFVHDGRFLVLLRLGGSNFYTSNHIITKLDSAMQRLGVILTDDSLDYNPPSWEFVKTCEGKLQMRDKSDFVFNYVPCGYKVKQDSLQMNNFSLIKQ